MPDPEILPERIAPKLKADLAELTTVVKAILKAIQTYESEYDPIMPEGTYLGIKFSE